MIRSNKVGVFQQPARWDTLAAKQDAATHKQFVEAVQKKLEQEFSSAFAKLSFRKISARSAQETPDEIRALFKNWIEETRRLTFGAQTEAVTITDLDRDFSRFRNIQF